MKKIIATVIIILSLGAFSFIYLENQSNNTPTIKEEPVEEEEPTIDKIQEQLDSLTLEEKIDLPKGKKVLVPQICTECGTTEWITIDTEENSQK